MSLSANWKPLNIPSANLLTLGFFYIFIFFGDAIEHACSGWVGRFLREIKFISTDPGTRKFILLCFLIGFLKKILFSAGPSLFWKRFKADFWLAGVFLIFTFSCISEGSNSIEPIIFLGSIMLGRIIAVSLALQAGKNIQDSFRNVAVQTSFFLIILFGLASVCKYDFGQIYCYNGQKRHSGPWETPNTFGLMMGTGWVFCLGHLFFLRRWAIRAQKLLVFFILLLALIFITQGLVASYCRGAWLGAFLGLVYLVVFASPDSKPNRHFGDNRSAVLAMVFLLLFCFLGQKIFQNESLLMRRASSVVDQNDFSWQNRIVAWKGALQMCQLHPWFGTGWDQSGVFYKNFYLPFKNDDSGAFATNDYLKLGVTTGLLVMICFLMHISRSFVRPCEDKAFVYDSSSALQHCCRAALVVLIVGFWFDGGIFVLPTSVVFWTFLEISAIPDGMEFKES